MSTSQGTPRVAGHHQKPGEARKGEGAWPWNTLVSDLQPPPLWDCTFLLFSASVCGALLRQPWKQLQASGCTDLCVGCLLLKSSADKGEFLEDGCRVFAFSCGSQLGMVLPLWDICSIWGYFWLSPLQYGVQCAPRIWWVEAREPASHCTKNYPGQKAASAVIIPEEPAAGWGICRDREPMSALPAAADDWCHPLPSKDMSIGEKGLFLKNVNCFLRKKCIFIWLRQSYLQHVGSLIFVAACGIFSCGSRTQVWHVGSSSLTRDQAWAPLHPESQPLDHHGSPERVFVDVTTLRISRWDSPGSSRRAFNPVKSVLSRDRRERIALKHVYYNMWNRSPV